ncbi:uncharacterized protein LOC134231713 [Saccostrea cucullata]|uniref:uncharacterized protein LOC134231713 n=1 Tax=Saccostrea cuccullata TaxID=36930 RepID=UPI002ED1A7BE
MKVELIKNFKPTVSAPSPLKENGIRLYFWPTLDTREIQKRKMNFNPRQYPLGVDFSQLTKAVLDGKKIENHRINPHHFRYVHMAADKCKRKKLHLVILVKSKASNFEMRKAIRKTWGNITDSDITIVFMLGHIAGFEAKISNESDFYADIVQEDFIDSYKNNTLKTTMAFNWVSQFCPNADFNLYVDDDIFVNLENVKKYLKRKERRWGLFAGQLLRFSTPYRDEGSKWFVSWKEYPFDKYPPYLGGFFILMSQDVTSYFSTAIPYIKTIPIDDAYLGIVAAKLNIMPKSCPGLVRNMPGSVSYAAVPMNFKTVIGYHLITSPESLLATWNLYKYVTQPQFQVIEKNGKQNIQKLKGKNKEGMKVQLIKDFKSTVSTPSPLKENGIRLYLWSTLDSREVQKRKMNFNPRQYPLGVDFSQLTKAVLDGKKIENHRINPHPFRYVHMAADRCKGKKLQLVILVKSKASNFEMRNAIRKTWGNITDSNITIVFMLGQIAGFEAKISNESNFYADIVQEDFIDSYKNNTLKTTMTIHWAAQLCPNADFNLYVDDDVFVNLENVKKYLKGKERRWGLFAGQLLRFSTPYRDEGSKWFVSWKEYPFDKYPPYLGGFFILMSQDVTSYFSIAIPYVKTIPIDDAYLGIVAAKLNIIPKSCPGLVRNMPRSVTYAAVLMNFKTVIGYHLITSPESLLATWNLYKHVKRTH